MKSKTERAPVDTAPQTGTRRKTQEDAVLKAAVAKDLADGPSPPPTRLNDPVQVRTKSVEEETVLYSVSGRPIRKCQQNDAQTAPAEEDRARPPANSVIFDTDINLALADARSIYLEEHKALENEHGALAGRGCRPALHLATVTIPPSFITSRSRFGGQPYRGIDGTEPHPCCQLCGDKMLFVLQLDLNQVTEEAAQAAKTYNTDPAPAVVPAVFNTNAHAAHADHHLMQLFMCRKFYTRDEDIAVSHAHNPSMTHLVRVIPSPAAPALKVALPEPDTQYLPARAVMQLMPFPDHPNLPLPQGSANLERSMKDWTEARLRRCYPYVLEILSAKTTLLGFAGPVDKVLGYADGSPSEPLVCPKCHGTDYSPVIQIYSINARLSVNPTFTLLVRQCRGCHAFAASWTPKESPIDVRAAVREAAVAEVAKREGVGETFDIGD
ncbi:hypothetical protein J8273_2050 [Carpediemonas membranifera]|uniref:Uncharacterized protein n=1 Tax=Carpediemonas membranifera TaxID=201153 RepID=A0A8J6B8A3_9EUKA|nr:hypothetical protein J8273_2050 [Carpediemonas membranifera]|eukprot:KAG9396319.1 hypothetical protein J8273_2050 [Carpediemonas membranifera]